MTRIQTHRHADETRSVPRCGRSGRIALFLVVMIGLAGRTLAQIPPVLTQVPSDELSITASDYYTYFVPAYVIDASVSTKWETRTTGEQWLQFDLGQSRWVAAVDVYATANRIKGYELYVSDEPNPASWGTPVATGELPNTTAYHAIIIDPAAAVFGRYLRLVVKTRWSTNIGVYELRVYERAFALADKETGCRGFTNSNVVDVAGWPVMTGYDRYQITDSPVAPTANWLAYDPANPPAGLEVALATPAEGAKVTRHAWFKDEGAGVKPTTNAPASITYVHASADVAAVAAASLSALTWGAAYPAVIRVGRVDAGSGSSIGLHSRALSVVPADDQTPGDPERITLQDAGNYTVTLTVTDRAGNTDTATTALSVTAGETGQISVWTGDGDGSNWFDSDNWSSAHYPGPGAAVTAAGTTTILLSESTAALASFAIGNGATLVFTNWNTTLQAADVTIHAQGKLTAAGPFRNEEMSNNVVIMCDTFELAKNGVIDLNGKGYAGAVSPEIAGHGPGGGTSEGSASVGHNGGGGGHGGIGGRGGWAGYPGSLGGPAYGTPAAPTFAGSGGSCSQNYPGYVGGPGGGAVRIEVTGRCLLNGLISADGEILNGRGGGGSGGSVAILCGTVAGTTGVVRANGATGTGQSGGGAGGRVAVVVTDTAAQAELPRLRLPFSAHRGQSGVWDPGELGSLYFSDPCFLDWSYMPHHGQLTVPGMTRWEASNLTITNGMIKISRPDFTLNVTNDLTLAGPDGGLELVSNNVLTVGGSLRIHDDVTLRFREGAAALTNADFKVGQDLQMLQNAALHYDGAASGFSLIDIGGNLIMSNRTAAGATTLTLRANTTNFAYSAAAVRLRVGGDMAVVSNAWVSVDPFEVHPDDFGLVCVSACNIRVSANAGFISDDKGFPGGSASGHQPGRGPGGGWWLSGSGPWGGGGYGGLGGYGALSGSGTTYGATNAPPQPGSGGAIRFSHLTLNGAGGGVVWLEAEQRIRLDGTISAKGQLASRGGAGSGGGVYIHCRRFDGTATGLVNVDGGNYTDGRDTAGGGGGGRIVIWSIRNDYTGATSALGGSAPNGEPGQPGSVYFGYLPAPGTLILVR